MLEKKKADTIKQQNNKNKNKKQAAEQDTEALEKAWE